MYRCTVCGYIYDEAKEGTPFDRPPDERGLYSSAAEGTL